ncbi:hypothetical protein [Clostridium pasteurianum]|uniref:Uncharacterized protein n=1 Tax=Clostridium pasteurianum BC1 TaxID=86416 RepID=R4K491_CLOPA|nr:hypothetical protein [Clostridium pasteurianum]AGK97408.1 hypothetical protein Clopa_2548 [Clostridium pasteurianum BC1]
MGDILDEYLNQTITYEKYKQSDGLGNGSYEATIDLPCRIEDKIKLVRDKKGNQVVVNNTIYLKGSALTLNVEDKLGGRVVIAVGTITDLDGENVGWLGYTQ